MVKLGLCSLKLFLFITLSLSPSLPLGMDVGTILFLFVLFCGLVGGGAAFYMK